MKLPRISGLRPVVTLLAVIYAQTSPLSAAGIRVVLPRLVPPRALDRANALDTAVHSVVDVAGPSLAGALMGFVGSIATVAVIAGIFTAATICVAVIRGETRTASAAAWPSQAFLRQALEGLIEVFRRKLLRGLAIGYALNMITWGILVVAVPVFVAGSVGPGEWESISGLVWAGVGLAGGVGAIGAGQLRIMGREARVMTVCMIGIALGVGLSAGSNITGVTLGLMLAGLMAGPIDVALLTLRQRRTDPARLGRVLAVSMSVNMSGFGDPDHCQALTRRTKSSNSDIPESNRSRSSSAGTPASRRARSVIARSRLARRLPLASVNSV